MKVKVFSAPFSTAGSLLQQESVKIAALYLEYKDWKKVAEITKSENVLRARTNASAKRQTSEIVSRLSALSDDEIKYLPIALSEDQKLILLGAILSVYPFMNNLFRELVFEHFKRGLIKFDIEDIRRFYLKQKDTNEILAEFSDSTIAKCIQRAGRLLVEVGMLTKDGTLRRLPASSNAKNLFKLNHQDIGWLVLDFQSKAKPSIGVEL